MYTDERDTLRDADGALYSMNVQLRQAKEIGIFAMQSKVPYEGIEYTNQLSDIVHAIDVIQEKLQALRNIAAAK